ncbi:MAG: glycosyltransferase family 2 protein [Candidatus Zixiibacteriota bacterium]|nr:MAG: glycosyltransferase family 2 protein [candidate division Zixibacteria bacterium]
MRHWQAAVRNIPAELILVDNNSTDGTPSLIRSTFNTARIIPLGNNTGFAAAANRGAREARGDFLLFLNPDAELDSDAVEALLDVVSNEPRAGLVSGRLRYPDGRFQSSCRRLPTKGNLLFSRGGLLSRLPSITNSDRYTLPDHKQVTIVPAAAATVAMIRRQTFAQLGGFDERFFLFMEDTDLCQRLNQAGFVNLFVPHAGAVHYWGRGSETGKWRRAVCHHTAMWRYFRKHHPGWYTTVILPVLLTGNCLIVGLLPDRRVEV